MSGPLRRGYGLLLLCEQVGGKTGSLRTCLCESSFVTLLWTECHQGGGDQGVKKGEFPILLRLHSELNVGSMKLRWEVNVGIWSEGRAVHLSST